MVSSLLQKTGKLGRPGEFEFLNPRGGVQMFLGRCHAKNLYEYFGYLRHEFSTPNGRFGMKATYPDFQPLIQRKAIAKLLGPVQFIHLTRRDVLRQAVSSALARKRNYWHAYNGKDTMPPDEDLEIDEAMVLRLVDQVLLERQSWERFFTLYGIQPLRITYEDMLADHRAVLDSVFRYLDMPIDARRFHAEPETQRLSNDVNERWVEEIRSRFPL
jgi:LPS sulfotransferase NodH